MVRTLVVDEDQSAQRLKSLEHRYRCALNSLTSARASYASLRELATADALQIRQALGRVERLQGRLSDLQQVMERIEDGLDAVQED